MAPAQVQKIVQGDLGAGMFPSLSPESIPRNGAGDITNGLLDEQLICYRRGGTSYLVNEIAGNPRAIWVGAETIISTDVGTFIVVGGKLSSAAFVVPFRGRPQALLGKIIYPGGATFDGVTLGKVEGLGAGKRYYAVASNRLLAGEGEIVRFSHVPQLANETPTGHVQGAIDWSETDYHALPSGAVVTGMEGYRDGCAVFTTKGIFVISGLTHELTDANGNIQQRLDRYSPQAILWGDTGIAGWSGGLVVPCMEDVWLMELGVSSERAQAFAKISDPITSVYRAHVAAGHVPGIATVSHGHYLLPILDAAASSCIDVLVCRLDAPGRPWTHFSGYGGRLSAYATTEDGSALVGLTPGYGRLVHCSYFEPGASAKTDADGSDIAFSVTYGDVQTGGNLRQNLVTKARLRYRMEAPASTGLRMSFGHTQFGGAEWGEFDWGQADWTALTGPFDVLSGEAPPDPSAVSPYAWRVGKKVRYARVKVDLEGPANDVSLRTLELFIRPDGKMF